MQKDISKNQNLSYKLDIKTYFITSKNDDFIYCTLNISISKNIEKKILSGIFDG